MKGPRRGPYDPRVRPGIDPLTLWVAIGMGVMFWTAVILLFMFCSGV